MPLDEPLGRFVLKSALFSAVFVIVWLVLYRPLSAAMTPDNAAASQSQMETYEKQVKRSEAMLAKSEAYAAKLEPLIQLQEDNARRHAAVLAAWERGAGMR